MNNPQELLPEETQAKPAWENFLVPGSVREALAVVCFLMLAGNIITLLWLFSEPTFFFIVVKTVYSANTIVMPSVLLVWAAVSFCTKRPRRWMHGVTLVVAFALMLVTVRVYATHIEPYRLQVMRYSIETTKVRDPLRIVHLSDIQTAAVGEYERRVFRQVAAQEPDLVLVTGDFLQMINHDYLDREIENLSVLFESLDVPLGVYGVVGNTDAWMETRRMSQLRGIRILKGEALELEWGGSTLHLMGTSFNGSEYGERQKIKPWFDAIPEGELTLVMGHVPNYVLDLDDLAIDLCFAGHTHGGQIVIPFVGPPITFSDIPRSKSRGLSTFGETRLHVSAGIGCERANALPRIRFFCPPDFGVFDFIPQE